MKRFTYILLIALGLLTATITQAQVSEQDSLALVALYNATDGPNWTNNTNWLSGPVLTWHGVSGTNGHVFSVSLTNNQLSGSIPAELGQLTELISINLSDNQLSGSIASELWQLPKLSGLVLNDNQLTGSLTAEIGQLTNLENIALHNNQLSGDFPQEFGLLTKLQTVTLYGNQFTGSIPAAVAQWPLLFVLEVQDNQFSTLPDLSAIPFLGKLNVENNQFEFDDIEPNVGITGFTYSPQDSFGIAQNSTVNLGDDLILHAEVGGEQNTYQWFKNNIALTGQNSATLTVLSSNNSDAGVYRAVVNNSIATALTLFGRPTMVTVNNPVVVSDSLALVALYNSTFGSSEWTNNTNWLNGPVSTWFGVSVSAGRVTELSLTNNKLDGPIPPEFGQLTGLSRLILNNNPHLFGPLPSEFGKLVNLTYLDLSGDHFRFLPPEIGQLSNLEILLLSGTKLEKVPSEINLLSKLSILALHGNHLRDLPDLSALPLVGLSVEGNILEFDDLEPNIGVANFTYVPQVWFAAARDTNIQLGGTVKLTGVVGGSQNRYQWFKDDVTLSGQTSASLTLSSIVSEDAGVYRADVTSTVVPELKISSRPWRVKPITPTESDSLALVSVYHKNGGQYRWGDKLNWLKGPIASWGGVTVTNGRVTKLSLPGKGLFGEISPKIWQMGRLVSLDLSNNRLICRLPKFEPGQMQGLNYFNLSKNREIGEIPLEIKWLINLAFLDMSETVLSGEIPSEIGLLNQLYSINLSSCGLTGQIPPEIGSLKNMSEVRLSHNKLSGQIPTEIGNLKELFRLELNNNQLTGNIPHQISPLTRLSYLNLSHNLMTGEIPTEIVKLTKLSSLFLNNNQFSGDVPAELANLDLLELWLSFNNFTGAIPTPSAAWKNLFRVELRNNRFTHLPNLTGSSFFVRVSAENNRFEFDDIEPNMGIRTFTYSPQDSIGVAENATVALGDTLTLTAIVGGSQNTYQWFKNNVVLSGQTNDTLTVFPVSHSDAGVYHVTVKNVLATALTLVGRPTTISVDNSVSAADSLALVALYNATGGPNWTNNTNWLNGPVATWFGVSISAERVSKLELKSNQLTGKIPPEIGQLLGLTRLDLNDNSFKGEIPSQIGALTNLTYLDLSGNLLTLLPPDIGQLSALEILLLFGNQFTSLPSEIVQLSQLTFLVLHDNQLTDFPDLSSLPLLGLSVEENHLEFDDLEPNVGTTNFTYAPQDSVGIKQDTSVTVGSSLTISVVVGGANNLYQWLKDGTEITDATESSYTIDSVDDSDAGAYTCKISNSVATDLTLYIRPIDVTLTVATGISDNSSQIPSAFALYENFPNPFNPSTTISFDLPQTSQATLVIYNLRGQLVRTLFAGDLPAGRHQFMWDGANDFGAQVASGIYLYRLKSDNFVSTRKLALVK